METIQTGWDYEAPCGCASKRVPGGDVAWRYGESCFMVRRLIELLTGSTPGSAEESCYRRSVRAHLGIDRSEEESE